MSARAIAVFALTLSACKGFQPASDAALPSDGELGQRDQLLQHGDGRLDDRSPGDRSLRDGSGAKPCRAIPLPCLDPADPKVIEVPTEVAKLQDAFASAKAGEVVQVKGLSVGPGWAVPAYVSFRGCAGAKLVGNIRFAGSGGTVEGFEVSGAGQVVANATGSYFVRFNRFLGGTLSTEAPLSARSIDGLVSAEVTLIAESNWFAGGARAITATTKYDTGVHSVSLTIRNTIFTGVERPVDAAEGGLVGKVKLGVEHNTFHAFKVAVSLFGMSDKTLLSGNLFQGGESAVEGSSPFEVQHCMLHQVKSSSALPPLSGSFATGDPSFADAAAGNFSLRSGSPAIDAIPVGAVVPSEDYAGCPRPLAYLGKDPKADLGALEARPYY